MSKIIFSIILILHLIGCATATVSSDFSPGKDFSGYKTFAWGKDQEPTGDLRFDDPVLRNAIKAAVESGLSQKGLVPAAVPAADLEVKYYLTAETKEDTAADYQMMYPPAYDPGAGVTRLNTAAMRENFMFEYEEGTFVLDLIDRGSNEIVWRGSLKGMLDPGASQSKRISRAPAAVAKVLNKYPPK